MGHFIKNKKIFNAYLDRLLNLNFEDSDDLLQSEEHLNDNSASHPLGSIDTLKSDRLH